MKIPLLLVVFLIFTLEIFSQEIPEISGETLNNKKVTLPKDLIGKFSLLCFASSQKAQVNLESWLDPVYQNFIAKTGLMDEFYDLNVYFIPVLTGTNISFATSMKNKFKESTQEDLQSHVLICKEKGREVLETLNMQKSDEPHFFLLNKEGKIIYKTTGAYTEEKFDAIDDLIE